MPFSKKKKGKKKKRGKKIYANGKLSRFLFQLAHDDDDECVEGGGRGGPRRSIHRNRGRAAFSRYPFAAIVLAAKIVSFNLPGVAALYKI